MVLEDCVSEGQCFFWDSVISWTLIYQCYILHAYRMLCKKSSVLISNMFVSTLHTIISETVSYETFSHKATVFIISATGIRCEGKLKKKSSLKLSILVHDQ